MERMLWSGCYGGYGAEGYGVVVGYELVPSWKAVFIYLYIYLFIYISYMCHGDDGKERNYCVQKCILIYTSNWIRIGF